MLSTFCDAAGLNPDLLLQEKLISDYLTEHFPLSYYCSEFKEQCLDAKKQHVSQPCLPQPTRTVYIPCKNNCLIHLHLHYPVLLSRSSSGYQGIANMSSCRQNEVPRPVVCEVTVRDEGSEAGNEGEEGPSSRKYRMDQCSVTLEGCCGLDGHSEGFLLREV